MKKILLLFAFILWAGAAEARSANFVRGYYKPSSGTYVAPSYRTKSNGTRLDNFSTKGNTNPYSGVKGYKPAYKTPSYKAPRIRAPKLKW